jgi:hypothetical protein
MAAEEFLYFYIVGVEIYDECDNEKDDLATARISVEYFGSTPYKLLAII